MKGVKSIMSEIVHVMFKRADGKYICNQSKIVCSDKVYKDIKEAMAHSSTFDNTPNAHRLMQALRQLG